GQCCAQPGIEIGEALPVLGRDRDRLAEPEFIRLQNSRLAGAALALIRDQDRGFARLAHEIGKCAVGWRRPGARVDQKHDRIGRVDGGLRLLLHAATQTLRCSLFQPGRVDSGERKIPEPCLRLAPVARDAGQVMDQSETLAGQAIEQGGLADIRPSDNGDREAHDARSGYGCRFYGPPAMESAISAPGADPAKQPRRATASIQARRRLPASVASAADPAIGPVIAPGPAERRRRAPRSRPSALPPPLVSGSPLPRAWPRQAL